MAEFCKKCFVNKLMTTDERRKLEAGQILIFESDWNDFCEGCGSVGPVVDKVRESNESVGKLPARRAEEMDDDEMEIYDG